MKLSKALTTVTPLSKTIAIILFIALPILTFLVGMKYQFFLTQNETAKENGITVPYASTSPFPDLSQKSNCTSDTDCKSGYACQAMQEQLSACAMRINLNGVAVNTTPSCTPTHRIISGICKLQKNGICSTDNDCLSGLICHTVQQENTTMHRCEPPVLGTCSGVSDTSCPVGYQCSEGCGSPIVPINQKISIPWYCYANEIAHKPRACPICLSSNTQISTPYGSRNVKDIGVGMIVWTMDRNGKKIAVPVVKIGNTKVPPLHQMVHLVLSDGRSLDVSPGHPTINGNSVSQLILHKVYDGSVIKAIQYIPYTDTKTYDILPGGETGFYWANNILVGSTLK